MFSLNGTFKKVGWSGNGKRNNLLGWPKTKTDICVFEELFSSTFHHLY